MPLQFTLRYVTRANLEQALTDDIGWCRETAVDLVHVEDAASDATHRDVACAAVLARASTERLYYDCGTGSQKIVGHQFVVALATIELGANVSITHALLAARDRWKACVAVAVVSSREDRTVLTCLLVPGAVGMRARATFDPAYRQKRHSRGGAAITGPAKSATACATASMHVVMVPVPQSDRVALAGEDRDATSYRKNLMRRNFDFAEANVISIEATNDPLQLFGSWPATKMRLNPYISIAFITAHRLSNALKCDSLNAVSPAFRWKRGVRSRPMRLTDEQPMAATFCADRRSLCATRIKGRVGIDTGDLSRSTGVVHTADTFPWRASEAELGWESSRPSQDRYAAGLLTD